MGDSRNGNITLISNPVSRITFAHGEMNRITHSLIRVDSSDSRAVSFSYDLNGNRTNITYPGGLRVAYSYDAENRLDEVIATHADFTNQFSFSYDGASRLTNIVYPNSVASAFEYDAESRVVGFRHGSFCEHAK